MKLIIISVSLLFMIQIQSQDNMKEVHKNGMTVKWESGDECIRFQMSAPTEGWVAIGFNETTSLAGTYLLMGRIRNGKVEVIEHYTEKPGSYKPIAEYGVPNQVVGVSGSEKGNVTQLEFSIPIEKMSRYHKQLSSGTKWNLLMAYSLDDDFQHHSIMRTAVDVKL